MNLCTLSFQLLDAKMAELSEGPSHEDERDNVSTGDIDYAHHGKWKIPFSWRSFLILSFLSADYLFYFIFFCILFFIILGKLRINDRITIATRIMRWELPYDYPCFSFVLEEKIRLMKKEKWKVREKARQREMNSFHDNDISFLSPPLAFNVSRVLSTVRYSAVYCSRVRHWHDMR